MGQTDSLIIEKDVIFFRRGGACNVNVYFGLVNTLVNTSASD